MEKLICGTAAYTLFLNDKKSGKLSHAYMLDFSDVKNLNSALKIFALAFFGFEKDSVNGRRLMGGNLPDCKMYPAEGKKLNAEAVAEILNESAMRPVEFKDKLFIISGFEQASALLQNKLLKTLEEPPQGVYFLLGVTTTAPILDTVKSRVKTLTIPPFTAEQIFEALQRGGENSLNTEAAESCGGIFGEAQNMVGGGWFKEVIEAAHEICTTTDIGGIGAVAIKYGDTKYKSELLKRIQQNFYRALCEKSEGREGEISKLWTKPALIYALESLDKACADLKFNAYYQGLLYDLMLRIIEENGKWLKLQA
ncbi:MAG: hypothetical protein K2O41_05785 [Clostridia bacterium]|nr:hypothetical protein [Clostridia bacterium]